MILKIVCVGCKRDIPEEEWNSGRTRCPVCGSMLVEITYRHSYNPEEDYD